MQVHHFLVVKWYSKCPHLYAPVILSPEARSSLFVAWMYALTNQIYGSRSKHQAINDEVEQVQAKKNHNFVYYQAMMKPNCDMQDGEYIHT